MKNYKILTTIVSVISIAMPAFTALALVALTSCDTGADPHIHNYSTTWKTDAANHWHECECGEKKDTAPHAFTDWTIDTPATTALAGSKHRTCTECQYKDTQTIPIIDENHQHDYSTAWQYDTTSHWHECECGEKKDTATHTPSDWIIDIHATTATTGSKHKECTECKYVLETEAIPMISAGHEHDAGTWHITLTATCSATGTKELRCTECDTVLDTQTIPIDSTNHTGGEKNGTTVPATCTTTGSQQILCTGCNVELRVVTITIDDNAHYTGCPHYNTITFDLQGGTYSGSTTNPTRTALSGNTISDIPIPERTGYVFIGWGSKISVIIAGTDYPRWSGFTSTTEVTEDRTVTAQWIQDSTNNFYWGSFIPAGSQPGLVQAGVFTKFDAEHLLQAISAWRVTEPPYTPGPPTENPALSSIFSGTVKTQQMNVTVYGYLFLVAPLSSGDAVIKNALNADNTIGWTHIVVVYAALSAISLYYKDLFNKWVAFSTNSHENYCVVFLNPYSTSGYLT